MTTSPMRHAITHLHRDTCVIGVIGPTETNELTGSDQAAEPKSGNKQTQARSMAFAAIIFVLCALATQSFAQECDCPKALNFHGNDVTQYGMSEGSPEALESVTACFWMSTPKSYIESHYATPLSYAAEGSKFGNEFTLMVKPHLVLVFKNRRFRTGLHLADGQSHHVCVTWESSSGDLKVYKDGDLAKRMVDVMTGQTITAGGTWVIGQDQDSIGGGFSLRDTFKGTLTGVNVWKRSLCEYEIQRVAKNCGSLIRGDYKAYSDFITSDAADFVEPACCQSDSISSSLF